MTLIVSSSGQRPVLLHAINCHALVVLYNNNDDDVTMKWVLIYAGTEPQSMLNIQNLPCNMTRVFLSVSHLPSLHYQVTPGNPHTCRIREQAPWVSGAHLLDRLKAERVKISAFEINLSLAGATIAKAFWVG